MTSARLHFAWRDRTVARRFLTAVCLHGHTMHSRETLDFLPRMAHGVALLRPVIAFHERRYEQRHGRRPEYDGAYWTPPLPERAAFRLEKRQIEELGLAALVSLTDHDSIDAALHLQLFEEFRSQPVCHSVEWTAPYGPTFFHLGIHNLPRQSARFWMARLAAYTRRPFPPALGEILHDLSARPEVLVVFNHPYWDEMFLGPRRHQAAVTSFLGEYGPYLHALELNGTRSWTENRAVLELARASGHAVVSGGDRHGLEPGAVLNLTRAASFDEFAADLRSGAPSEILIMPQYREPLQWRYAEAFRDILRDYPEFAGRERWTDRCFLRSAEGDFVPFSSTWNGAGPGPVAAFVGAVRLLNSHPFRSALRLAFRARGEALP